MPTMIDMIDILDDRFTSSEKRKSARTWLHQMQRRSLPVLRSENHTQSLFSNKITLIAYTFPSNEKDFDFIEFAIRQSWHCLGLLKTIIIADRTTKTLSTFATKFPKYVSIQIEPTLRPGSLSSMSTDCIERLHERFVTPYCLIIQDDGFPLNGNLEDFIGKYDYIGAPPVRNTPFQHIIDILRLSCLNGGFSLRSKCLCQDVAKQWRFWRHFIKQGSISHTEDVFYTNIACRNPLFRLKYNFPSCKIARQFSLPDFDGAVDIRGMRNKTFGVHGPTAIWQLLSDNQRFDW